MNITERAKNIIIKPKDEWFIIDQEPTSVQELVTGYLLPLSLIPAVAALIGFGFIAPGAMLSWGIKYAVMYFITMIAGVYFSAYIIDMLAPNFGATKDFRKAMQLVTYTYTPILIAGILYIIPTLGTLVAIAGLYGLYLLYLGLTPMMKAPEDKAMTYFVLSLIIILVVWAILSAVLSTILIPKVYPIVVPAIPSI
jgi:hypothetical protein